MMHRSLLAAFILALAFSSSVPLRSVGAVAQDEINGGTNAGARWLATQRDAKTGAWNPSYSSVGSTGLAVASLELFATVQGHSPFINYTYGNDVSMGLNYLFANAHTVKIGIQKHDTSEDNSDTDGDGIGVYFYSPETSHSTYLGWSTRDITYETSIALIALASSTTPDRIVTVADSPTNGWTYRRVAQDVVDFLAWAQVDKGADRGGWNYEWSDNGGEPGDNSNAGFATLALLFAENPARAPPEIGGFGLTVPPFVKRELDTWINYIQNGDGGARDGGSGYRSPTERVNILKTGQLLEEMAFVGDVATTGRVQKAIAYLARHWHDPNMGLSESEHGWKGTKVSNYQATFTVMKGLIPFHFERVNSVDWYDDFATVIVKQQSQDGSWPAEGLGAENKANSVLSTAFALLTLMRAAPLWPVQPLTFAFSPIIIVLMIASVALGLAIALWSRRRRGRLDVSPRRAELVGIWMALYDVCTLATDIPFVETGFVEDIRKMSAL
jgi:hypothetical protein